MLYLLYSLCLHHTLLTRPAIPQQWATLPSYLPLTRPAIPQQWVTDDGYIRLCVAKGTLVRYTPLACYMP